MYKWMADSRFTCALVYVCIARINRSALVYVSPLSVADERHQRWAIYKYEREIWPGEGHKNSNRLVYNVEMSKCRGCGRDAFRVLETAAGASGRGRQFPYYRNMCRLQTLRDGDCCMQRQSHIDIHYIYR